MIPVNSSVQTYKNEQNSINHSIRSRLGSHHFGVELSQVQIRMALEKVIFIKQLRQQIREEGWTEELKRSFDALPEECQRFLLNQSDEHNQTLLYEAVLKGSSPELLAYLVQKGAILYSNNGGNSPLHVALLRGAPKEIFAYILTSLNDAEKRALVNDRFINRNESVIEYALLMKTSPAIVALLLRAGADITAPITNRAIKIEMGDISVFHYALVHSSVDKKIALLMISYLTAEQKAILLNQEFYRNASCIVDRGAKDTFTILDSLEVQDRSYFLHTRDKRGKNIYHYIMSEPALLRSLFSYFLPTLLKLKPGANPYRVFFDEFFCTSPKGPAHSILAIYLRKMKREMRLKKWERGGEDQRLRRWEHQHYKLIDGSHCITQMNERIALFIYGEYDWNGALDTQGMMKHYILDVSDSFDVVVDTVKNVEKMKKVMRRVSINKKISLLCVKAHGNCRQGDYSSYMMLGEKAKNRDDHALVEGNYQCMQALSTTMAENCTVVLFSCNQGNEDEAGYSLAREISENLPPGGRVICSKVNTSTNSFRYDPLHPENVTFLDDGIDSTVVFKRPPPSNCIVQ